MLTTHEKIERVEKLKRDYDHVFLDATGVRYFLDPFGVAGGVEKYRANPEAPKGLTLHNGAEEAEGQDAAVVAEKIAKALGCTLPGLMGRGFRLRAACDAAIAKLKESL